MSLGTFTWKYADCVNFLLAPASMNPLRWSSYQNIEDFRRQSDLCGSRPVIVRFFLPNGDFAAARIYTSASDARSCIEKIATLRQPILPDNKCWDTWDPLRLTGPDGLATQALEHVPVVGSAINKTHTYVMGRAKAGERGYERHTRTLTFVPVVGQIQALVHEDEEVREQSLARSNGMTATLIVGAFTGPIFAGLLRGAMVANAALALGASASVAEGAVVVAAAAGAGAVGQAAGNIVQAQLERAYVRPDLQEKAKLTTEEWAKEIGIAAAAGMFASIGSLAYASYFSNAAATAAAEGGEVLARTAASEASEAITNAAINESLESVAECSLQAAGSEVVESALGRALQQHVVEEAADDFIAIFMDQLTEGACNLGADLQNCHWSITGGQAKESLQSKITNCIPLIELERIAAKLKTTYGGDLYNLNLVR